MNVAVVCSDPSHPIWPQLQAFASRSPHRVHLHVKVAEAAPADVLFLVSCHEIVNADARRRFKKTLVLHASDLPLGRGWSPHIWQILEGRHEFVVTLLEAADNVDSGPIWAQQRVTLEGHELADEINAKLFAAEVSLLERAVTDFDSIVPRPQDDRAPTYYKKRSPQDSELDPEQSIAAQFDLLRVADPSRFPAFFWLRGHKYLVRLQKADHD